MFERTDHSLSSAPSHLRSDATRRLHIVALLTTLATFPLIFMGGLVTSHHAGMSVPDWPNSYGYNMFLFPPSQWVGGIFYEHTHRLAGTIVGFCSVVLTLFAWGVAAKPHVRRILVNVAVILALLAAAGTGAAAMLASKVSPELHAVITQNIVALAALDLVLIVACFATTPEPRRWVRWTATAVLGMVLFQGLLGGLRVVLIKLDLAIVHACTAQAFFCLAAFAAIITSKWWFASDVGSAPRTASSKWPEGPHGGPYTAGPGLALLSIATVAIIYLQLIVGATMRHFDAGLAIPDLPLAYGHVLPPTSEDTLAVANHHRAFDLQLDPVTLSQIWVHFAHRIGALLVTALVLTLTITVFRKHRRGGLLGPAITLLILLCAQITLGALTVLLRKPADVASAHVAVGALVLASSFWLAVRALRLYRPQWRTILSTSDSTEASSRDQVATLVTT